MQFAAILADTWRLLSARKVFWVALAITVGVGLLYASLGFTDRGFTLFFALELPSDLFFAGSPGAAALALNVFYYITEWWTTLFGVILGLITCASLFPDFMAPGSIDTVLSKPLGRWRLFFYKYLSGLLFAAVLVVVLAVMAFLTIRWRLGFWHPAVFWSVPLGVLLYSYLYSVCVFFGVVTRSTLASLLLTLVFWIGCWGLQWAEQLSAQLSRTTSAAAALTGEAKGMSKAEVAHQIFRGLMFVLPKTGETTALVENAVLRTQDREYLREKEVADQVARNEDLAKLFGNPMESEGVIRARVIKDMEAMSALEKSPGYIIGTSLAFQAVVLLLSAWLFARRDY
jgi:ABC-type transport system involved in multi-copper enzyme maturation permease subunit